MALRRCSRDGALPRLCTFQHLQRGFHNHELRQHVAALLGFDPDEYSPECMTYDLRLKGIIFRLPRSNRYLVTSYGLRVALFSPKLYLRLLGPAWAPFANDDDLIPRPLRSAFQRLEIQIYNLSDAAQLRAA